MYALLVRKVLIMLLEQEILFMELRLPEYVMYSSFNAFYKTLKREL